MRIRENAKKLKEDIPAVFLALKDENTPIGAKIFAAITISYALSPIDLIPDFIPVLGYLDDLILLPALTALTIKLIPRGVWEHNRKRAADMWADDKPKKWYYAVPILAIWLLLLCLVIKVVCF